MKCDNVKCKMDAEYYHNGLNIYLCSDCIFKGGFAKSKGFCIIDKEKENDNNFNY